MIEIKRREGNACSMFSADMPPLLQRIYAQRGIQSEAELTRSTESLLNYRQLFGIEKAVHLLAEAMLVNKRIVIVGDFDVDGATSVALTVSALRSMGYQSVDYLVPNRFEDGYGLSPEVVQQAVAKGAEFIITVDNGVSSIEGVAMAKSLGLQVLVTDHHLPGHQLPQADAIVNPNLFECDFPSKSLAGVGVAFYLMLALRAHLREIKWFEQRQLNVPNLAQLLDLVALGTVADVVALDGNNRILVHQGLMRIRRGHCRAGIRALIEVSKRSMENLVASDFGFSLGPRLNAAGRLEDMSLGVELLLHEDLATARLMAHQLEQLNVVRRDIEQEMKNEAIAICERLKFAEGSQLPFGLALYQDEWHQGVIGILASRIKEAYHRPVIAFARGNEGEIKGSARSIQGLHMRDALDLIDTQNPGLIKKFGGHAMAAGLTIAADHFAQFAQCFDEVVRSKIDENELKGVIFSDGVLLPEEMNLHYAEILRDAGPWGQGFPEPLFDGKFRLVHQKIVGEKHLKMTVIPLFDGVEFEDLMMDGIAFNVDLQSWPDLSVQQVEFAYRLTVNDFRGHRQIQLNIVHLQAL